ncbi:transposase [Streptomyces smyrnaeus]
MPPVGRARLGPADPGPVQLSCSERQGPVVLLQVERSCLAVGAFWYEAEGSGTRLCKAVRPEVWVVDNASFPKCGTASVAVARQYCGLWASGSRRRKRRPATPQHTTRPEDLSGRQVCRLMRLVPQP